MDGSRRSRQSLSKHGHLSWSSSPINDASAVNPGYKRDANNNWENEISCKVFWNELMFFQINTINEVKGVFCHEHCIGDVLGHSLVLKLAVLGNKHINEKHEAIDTLDIDEKH